MASTGTPQVVWKVVRAGEAVAQVTASVTPASEDDGAKREFEIRPGWRDTLGPAVAQDRLATEQKALERLAAVVQARDAKKMQKLAALVMDFCYAFPLEVAEWGDAAFSMWVTGDLTARDKGRSCRAVFVEALEGCKAEGVTHSVIGDDVVVRYKLTQDEELVTDSVSFRVDMVRGLGQHLFTMAASARTPQPLEPAAEGSAAGGAIAVAEENMVQGISFAADPVIGAVGLDDRLHIAIAGLARSTKVSSPTLVPKEALEKAVVELFTMQVEIHARSTKRRLQRTAKRATHSKKEALFKALALHIKRASAPADPTTPQGSHEAELCSVLAAAESRARLPVVAAAAASAPAPAPQGVPPAPHYRPSLYGDKVVMGDPAHSQQSPIRIHLVATASTRVLSTRGKGGGRDRAKAIMRAFFAKTGIDSMDTINDGQVDTVNMPEKKHKQALAFKLVPRPQASTITALFALILDGYKRVPLALDVGGTQKHFWVVLGSPGVAHGGIAAPVFSITMHARLQETSFLDLMEAWGIVWFLFRVGSDPFSVNNFYPLDGGGNKISFVVFEPYDFAVLARLALHKPHSVVSIELDSPPHSPVQGSTGRSATAAAGSAAAGGASAGTAGSRSGARASEGFFWRSYSEINERLRDGEHGVVLFGLTSRTDNMSSANAFLKSKLGDWGQLGAHGLGKYETKFEDLGQIVWSGISWAKVVQVVDMVADLRREGALMGGSPPSALSLQMEMEYKDVFGLGCGRCMEMGHTAAECLRQVGRCTLCHMDMPVGVHAGTCGRDECSYPNKGVPKANSRRLFKLIHIQYIAINYCAEKKADFMPWFETVQMQMKNGATVAIARNKHAAEQDAASAQVMEAHMLKMRKQAALEGAKEAPRMRKEVAQLMNCVKAGMDDFKSSNPNATADELMQEAFIQNLCVVNTTDLLQAAAIATRATVLSGMQSGMINGNNAEMFLALISDGQTRLPAYQASPARRRGPPQIQNGTRLTPQMKAVKLTMVSAGQKRKAEAAGEGQHVQKKTAGAANGRAS